MTVDLLGNGTACLVWSSPLPADARRPLRYIDLMGGTKPHLLVSGSTTSAPRRRFSTRPSHQFYLEDQHDGRPWVTRLPFPVHVVERVETYDRISGNRFVTRFAYHHGYFDGVEREFRGFGMVERWDTEEIRALAAGGHARAGTNVDASSSVPPILTKTWFHTGVYDEVDYVSAHFAAEYYGAPRKTDPSYDAKFEAFFEALLPDTVLPPDLTREEEREACRALKGSMLRHEVYAQDGTDEAEHPYTVTEQNFTIRTLQPRGANRHGVFFTHSRESISYHYERKPADPRVAHALTLEVDDFGNVLQAAAIGYGRRQPDLDLSPLHRAEQAQILITHTENRVTNAVDAADDHRTPLPCESRMHELTGLRLLPGRDRFTFDEVLEAASRAVALDYEKRPTPGRREKRLIEHVRTYYRRNDLSQSLPRGVLQSLALPFATYKLAFTPGLVAQVYAGRVTDAMLANEGRYVHTEGDANWWIPSGQTFYSGDPGETPVQELAYARQHFFLPHRYRDPFHTDAASTDSLVTYDAYDLLVEETRDALDNRVTAGERDVDPTRPLVRRAEDYRVLQAGLVMDANRNRSAVAFDALGMVAGTAVMGKPAPATVEGDSLDGFAPDLTQAETDQFLAEPKGPRSATLLADATTRMVYDLTAYWREPYPGEKPAVVAATIARETHVSDLPAGQQSRIRVSLSYSDGFGREIQKKIQAESGPAPRRDDNGTIILGADGHPLMTPDDVSPRWVGSGWTVFNNKGKPVRQYEPFFTDTHRFEFDVRDRRQPGGLLRPGRTSDSDAAPRPHLGQGGLRPLAAGDLGRQRHGPDRGPHRRCRCGRLLRPLAGRRTTCRPGTRCAATRPTPRPLRRTIPTPPTARTRRGPPRRPEFMPRRPPSPTPTRWAAPSSPLTHNGPVPRGGRSSTWFRARRGSHDIEGNQRDVTDAHGPRRHALRLRHARASGPPASMEAGARWMLERRGRKTAPCLGRTRPHLRADYDPLRRPLRSRSSAPTGGSAAADGSWSRRDHLRRRAAQPRGSAPAPARQGRTEARDAKRQRAAQLARLTKGTCTARPLAAGPTGLQGHHCRLTCPAALGPLAPSWRTIRPVPRTYDALNRAVR